MSSATSTHAILLSTSKYWFNYRHTANVLSIYRTIKKLGIPDTNILLFLPDDMPCNPRNCLPGKVINDRSRKMDLYGDDIEVDFRGSEVTVENLVKVLTGKSTCIL